MKAVVLRETGPAEQLVYDDVPDPEPADGSELVRVRAAGINFMDVLVRQGNYPQPPALPAILGAEVAGEVDGRRVVGLTRLSGGGYAEWALIDKEWLVDLPPEASFAEGAAFLMTFLTAWIPMIWQAPVRPGSTVLVHAAAGGVGSAAVQVARHFGARVIATASSEEKLEVPRSLGAEVTLTYEGFAERVREETGGRGADVVIDPVGGQVFADSLSALAPLGVIVGIGFAGGTWADEERGADVGRNIGIQGFYLGRLMKHEPALVHAALVDLVALWEAGELRPVVGAEFPLADAPGAHRLIEERRSTGKVVLVP